MPNFGLQVTNWTWSTQPTHVSVLPLQLGSRGSQSTVEYLKYPKDLKFDSNIHSIWDVFPLEFLWNIYTMLTPVTQLLFLEQNKIRVQSLTFFKWFICNMLLQLFTNSGIITAPRMVVPFCSQDQLWGGFPSTNIFLWPFNTTTLVSF